MALLKGQKESENFAAKSVMEFSIPQKSGTDITKITTWYCHAKTVGKCFKILPAFIAITIYTLKWIKSFHGQNANVPSHL